ncbi:hypothetical protein LQG66_35710 [Bradyrhizobium ontarionense]|uniref:DUF4148 domain-containing protein n=1 Tax=Bradyrhizobium ontarionense TaxID=2898149 RepID=A0ABY3RBA0_9BRAD|nr:hypothetical protein [Bradyrhizobium sp. A19]UFZ04474.1 hypothetical protein LQG66_35710 [Bradyrhizobium sp. A19]
MRLTLTFAALVAGLGGILAVAQAGEETAPELVPVSRAHDGAWTHLAQFVALQEQAESRSLSYEPARREREGDDDEQDEPRH